MRGFFVFFMGVMMLGTLSAQPGKVYKSIEEVNNPDDVYILDLKWKRLRSVPPEVFTYKNLRVLNLSRNRIDTLPPEIAQLQQLEVLNMGRNVLRQLPMELALLSHLKELDVSRNPLMDLPESMAYLSSLESLVLWSTAIYQLPESFSELDSSLRVLDLRSCQLSITDQEAIRQMLPSVKILWDQACNCR